MTRWRMTLALGSSLVLVHLSAVMGAYAGGVDASAIVEEIGEASRDNDHATVIRLARQWLPLLDQTQGMNSNHAEYLAHMLGRSLFFTDRPADAKPYLERTAQSANHWQWSAHRRFWATIFLGRMHRENGDLTRAMEYFQKARGIFERHSLDDECRTEVPLQIGETYRYLNDYERAIVEYGKQKSALIARFGVGHQRTVWGDLNIALCQIRLRNYKEARVCRERALAIREQSLGQTHVDTLLTRLAVAETWALDRHHDKAKDIAKEIEKIVLDRPEIQEAKPLPPGVKRAGAHPNASSLQEASRLYGGLAEVYRLTRETQKRIQARTKAFELAVLSGTAKPYSLTGLATSVAEAHHAASDCAGANRWYERQLEIARAAFDGTANTATPLCRALYRLGDSSQCLGRYRESEERFREALAVAEKHLGADSSEAAYCFRYLSNYCRFVGQVDLADEYFERHVTIFRAKQGQSLHLQAQWKFKDALRSFERGQPDLARRQIQEARQWLVASDEDVWIAKLSELAQWFDKNGDYESALQSMQEAVQLLEPVRGENSLLNYRLELASFYIKVGRLQDARTEIQRVAHFTETSDSFRLCKL